MILYKTIPLDMPKLHRLYQITGYVTAIAFRSDCVDEMKLIHEVRDDLGALVVVWNESHYLPLMNAFAEAWTVINNDMSPQWGIRHVMKGAIE